MLRPIPVGLRCLAAPPPGSRAWFDSFTVRRNGYLKAPDGAWISWGWTYDFPVDIEGGRTYTVKPFSSDDVFATAANTLFERRGHLVDDPTGRNVGIAVNESMDVRIMGSAPGGPNQH